MSQLPAVSEIRAQVERILAQPQFTASTRLSGFLRFIVEEVIAGRQAEIKEYSIGVSVYQKSENYDPRIDPSVRVDARKLRSRLSEYYEGAGREDQIVISIPLGTYVPTIEGRVAEAPAPRPFRPWWGIAVVSATVILCAFLGTRLVSGKWSKEEQRPRLLNLTSYPGEQTSPSLSPDGSMVAFSWNGELQDNYDIYVKVVDGANPLRLTSDPGRDVAPAWSPDGRQIAFLRNPGKSGEVYVISALGGEERRVTSSSGQSVGWTADSKNVLVVDHVDHAGPFAGFQVSVESGERRQITFPEPGSFFGDYDLHGSPDGSSIAFCRMDRPPVAQLWALPAGGGTARKITESHYFLRGWAWTPDSRNIVFSSEQNGFPALWMVRGAPGAVPSLLPGVETEATRPSIPMRTASLDHIAYQRREQPFRIWRVSLSGGGMSKAVSIAPSQRADALPRFSPDGEWIAFGSNRGGPWDIWVCRRDGTGLRNLTTGSQMNAGAPVWSPDGSSLAFDANPESGNHNIYVVPSSGGQIKRLTAERSEDVRPSWSRDGRSIYFTSDRSGTREIWKIGSNGTAPVQVTNGGGFTAAESMDGSLLYFFQDQNSKVLWRMPVAGGKPVRVLEGAHHDLWSVTKAGVFYVDASQRICRLEASGTICVGAIERQNELSYLGFDASPDGKETVFIQPEPAVSSLRMLEGKLLP